MPPTLTGRIPVHDDESGGLLGWVMWDEMGEFAELGEYVVPNTFYLRLPSSPAEPSLQLTFAIRDGASVCVAATLEAKPQGRELLPKDFNSVRRDLTTMSEQAFSCVVRASEQQFPGLVDDAQARRAYQSGRARSRRKVTDELLREVAALYRDNIGSGPWQAITERFKVSRATAGRYVMLARQAGHLPQTTPGKKRA
jgi:hypothetical protein